MTISSSTTFLPAGATAFFRRRLIELGGLTLFGAAGLFAAALVTFSPQDPSFNNVSSAATRNILGPIGAHLADLSLQFVGAASVLVVLTLAAWAWRLTSHRGLPFGWMHIAVLPVGAVLAAGAASGLTPIMQWGVAAGVGGVVGLLVQGWLMDAVAMIGVGSGDWLATLILAVVALPFALFALGLSPREWRAMLGRLTWFGMLFVRIGLWGINRVKAARAARPFRPRQERREPVLHGGRAEPALLQQTEDETQARPEEDAAVKTLLRTPERPDPDIDTPSARVAKSVPRLRKSRRATAEAQATLDLGGANEVTLPPLSLLTESKVVRTAVSEDALEQNARMLEGVLEDFGVRGEITKVHPGPVVTLYELEPARGTKASRVIGLADDIARSMSAISARVATIPGHNAIGIELPNARRETVYLRELLASDEYDDKAPSLTLALGKDISGDPVFADLARMPHLLVAGTTGSGKSVAINSMILSLLYRLKPEQCRMIMIDPKMLELSVYDDIPHLLAPVVTEPGKAVVALKWAVREMEQRYRIMSHLGVRNIAGYNQRLADAKKKGENLNRTVQTGFDPDTGEPMFEEQPLDLEPMPFIVVIVDEMADLMLIAGKDIEASVQRLAQMARAAGIHLIMATQRPSVDVITGTIKANFPTRISFQVTSKIDSRTILGEPGAETLLGSGDMLYMLAGGKISRVHGPFVTDGEVEKVVNHLRGQATPSYIESITEEPDAAPTPGLGGGNAKEDEMYDRAVDLICREGKASTSFVQRHLQIGYNRAARIIERMEAEGVVGQANHVGKREVLARVIPREEQ
ncbi:MAG: DNA translocase FtsK 4TM domain-containing protein [Proteobacteria bacterium]|nr:DNA translocase FtsK 4TM domain-containing protein [Pseudomonadota bacterium]MDA1057892.1 DNA translocase FtsK 4TM domain-containing protein [Pseudomonadota bacterium]